MPEKNDFNASAKINIFDPGFEEIANAIITQNKGKEVTILIKKPLFREDYFQLTKTFPGSIASFRRSYKILNAWKKLFSIAPQLAIPQKVIYASTNRKWLTNMADFWFKNSDQKKSDYINISLPENLSFLNFEKLQGIVFQEYKINVSRLYIELLKVFERAGGKLIFESDSENAKEHNKTESVKIKSYETSIACPANFNLCIDKENIEILFSEKNGNLAITITGQNFDANIFLDFLTDKNTLYKESRLPHLLNEKAVLAITAAVQQQLFCTFENTSIENNYELCLEKFDIAKQTGIDFPAFSKLFYRYGFYIERLTDIVYEEMVSERDPEILWKNAEIKFQKKYEWGS